MNTVKPKKSFRRLTDTEKDRILELYQDGLTFREIAAELGRSRETVRKHLVYHRVHAPKTNRYLGAEDVQKMLDWYIRGVRTSDICRRFGIYQTTLYHQLRKHGIPLRYPAVSTADEEANR